MNNNNNNNNNNISLPINNINNNNNNSNNISSTLSLTTHSTSSTTPQDLSSPYHIKCLEVPFERLQKTQILNLITSRNYSEGRIGNKTRKKSSGPLIKFN
jgi:hypothetical protein